MSLYYKNEESDEFSLLTKFFVRNYPEIPISIRRNSKEDDIMLLLIGVPSKIENILSGESLHESMDFLMKFSRTTDLASSHDFLNPAFISAISNLMLSDNSYAFYLIPMMKNIWSNANESSPIFFTENLIASFCNYLSFPYEVRSFVFEAFTILLKVLPNKLNESILNLLLSHNLFDSFTDFFQQINSEFGDDSPIYLSKYLNLIYQLTLNPCLDRNTYTFLLSVTCTFLSNEKLTECRIISCKILARIIIELEGGEFLLAIPDCFTSIILSHYLNDPEMLNVLYQCDTCLLKFSEFREEYINNHQFLRNLIEVLNNSMVYSELKPLFAFLIQIMPLLWMQFYHFSERFDGSDAISLISILLNKAQHSSSCNKIYPALCISAFLLNANHDIKKEVAMNGGLEVILQVTPMIEYSDIEDLTLLLEGLYHIFSTFEDSIEPNLEFLQDVLLRIESYTDATIVKYYDLLCTLKVQRNE